jgi:hypothetical protein
MSNAVDYGKSRAVQLPAARVSTTSPLIDAIVEEIPERASMCSALTGVGAGAQGCETRAIREVAIGAAHLMR